jgi:hypothetical protein
LIQLTQHEWTRLYKEVLILALRMTHTKVHALEWTTRDWAQKAVQDACMRYFRRQPAGIDTVDDLRRYLVWAVRSELGHAKRLEATRHATEGAAAAEAKHLGEDLTPSPEAMHLGMRQRLADEAREERLVRKLRQKLADAKDTIAFATMDLIAEDKTSPAEQARALGCDVEEIYNARKRRKRAMEQVLEEDRDEEDA